MALLAGFSDLSKDTLGFQPQGSGRQVFDNSVDPAQNDQGSVRTAGTLNYFDVVVTDSTLTLKVSHWRLVGGTMTLLNQSTEESYLANTVRHPTTGNLGWTVDLGDWFSFDITNSGRLGLFSAGQNNAVRWTGDNAIVNTDFPFVDLDSQLNFEIAYSGIGDPSASDTITIDNQANANQKNIATNNFNAPLTGTYSGTPTSLERRVRYNDGAQETITGLDWAVFDASPSGNAYSSSVTIPAQNRPIVIEVRFSNDTGVTNNTALFYIGDFYFNHGESIAEDMNTDGTGTPSQGVFQWDHNTDTLSTAQGSGDIEFANTLTAETGHAVFIENFGVGGTKLLQANGTPYLYDPAVNQAQYQELLDAISAATGGIAYVVLNIGANDAFFALSGTAAYESGYGSYFTKLRTDSGLANLPVIASISGRHLDGAASVDWPDYVAAQRAAFDNDANVHWTSFLDQPLKDNVHPTEAGYDELGRRLANAVIAEVYSGSAPYRTPSITSVAVVSDTQTVFNISTPEGGDFTPTTAITYVELSEDGFTSTVAISSVDRTNATSFTATHASATITNYRYNYERAPDITGIVQDNSARALPLTQFEGPVSVVSIPTADAGPNQFVSGRELVQLDGSGSTGSGPLTYNWHQTAGTTVALSSNTDVMPTFIAPNTLQTLTFRLIVDDGEQSEPDFVDITIDELTGGNNFDSNVTRRFSARK